MEITSKQDIFSPAKIQLTLRYSVQQQRLIVDVHHVEGLELGEAKGLYVKLYVLPDEHRETKRKTKVVKSNKNPIFNEKFEYVISQDDLETKQLEISLCEEGIIKNAAIEKVVIELNKLSLVLPHKKLFSFHKVLH